MVFPWLHNDVAREEVIAPVRACVRACDMRSFHLFRRIVCSQQPHIGLEAGPQLSTPLSLKYVCMLHVCRVDMCNAQQQTIQEMSLDLSKQNQVTGHREQMQNESFRRQKSELSRRCVGAEARVAALEVSIFSGSIFNF